MYPELCQNGFSKVYTQSPKYTQEVGRPNREKQNERPNNRPEKGPKWPLFFGTLKGQRTSKKAFILAWGRAFGVGVGVGLFRFI
jgi:hypothetical protein